MKTRGGYLISRIKHLSNRAFDRKLSECGIDAFNGAQGRILYVLWQQDGVSISQIARQTSLAKPTLTSMLDRMEASGLIQRQSVSTDRRQQRIVLTERARSLQRDYDRISDEMSELFYQGFTDEEIAQFEGYLLRVLHNVEGGDSHDQGNAPDHQ